MEATVDQDAEDEGQDCSNAACDKENARFVFLSLGCTVIALDLEVIAPGHDSSSDESKLSESNAGPSDILGKPTHKVNEDNAIDDTHCH